MRCLFAAYALVLAGVSRLRAALNAAGTSRAVPPSHGDDGFVIIATGTFFSANWLRSHILPLLASPACARLILVCDQPLLTHAKLVNCCPPAWLRRVMGRVPARSLMLLVTAMRRRPDFVMGYHLIPNGLVALLAARLSGAQAIYQCCGGESELDGGGPAMFENGLLRRVRTADARIAARLRSFTPQFDLIITRGDRAANFFAELGCTAVTVIPAGIDAAACSPNGMLRDIDLIMVSRLVEMKRADLFVEIVAQLVQRGRDVRAVVVGDGPERPGLEARIRTLGLERHVMLAGQQTDVVRWLHRAKVFVLPSDSEGLSIALAEAMMSGLPAVVSRVGDLPMLVADHVSGFLVPRGDVAAFVDRLERLLDDEALRSALAVRARQRALCLCSREEVTRRWTQVLRAVGRQRAVVRTGVRPVPHDAGETPAAHRSQTGGTRELQWPGAVASGAAVE